MARLFSIDFDFQNQHYSALVTVGSAANGNARYMVATNDDDLKTLLPGGKLSFNDLSDLGPIAESQPRLQGLLLSMVMAMHQKLQPAAG